MSDFKIEIPVTKRDTAQMLAFGFANVPVTADGQTVVDRHNEEIDPVSLEKAAYQYVLHYREGGEEHKRMGVARLVESFYMTSDKLSAMGLSSTGFVGSAWWVGFKVDDPDVWKKVEDGSLSCFSIGGTALAEDVK